MLSVAKMKEELATPLSDADIREYLPHALILKYSEIDEYGSLHNLLPDVKSFCIILYEDSPNSGHWIVVSRPDEGVAEYFDSYGGYVDAPLTWTSKEKRDMLGAGMATLHQFFDECSDEVVYNKIKYQREGQDIANCGRWCVLRTLKMKEGLNLNEFHKFCERKSKEFGMNFDKMVTQIIQ